MLALLRIMIMTKRRSSVILTKITFELGFLGPKKISARSLIFGAVSLLTLLDPCIWEPSQQTTLWNPFSYVAHRKKRVSMKVSQRCSTSVCFPNEFSLIPSLWGNSTTFMDVCDQEVSQVGGSILLWVRGARKCLEPSCTTGQLGECYGSHLVSVSGWFLGSCLFLPSFD